MKRRMGSVLSSLLCCCLLFSVLSLNVNAADGSSDIIASNMDLSVTVSPDTDVTDLCSSMVWNSTTYSHYNGFFAVRMPSDVVEGTVAQAFLLSENFDIVADHEYELSFEYGCFANYLNSQFLVSLIYYDSSGNEIKTENLYNVTGIYSSPTSVNFSFKPDVSDISGGYTCKLYFCFYMFASSQTTPMYVLISENISLIDKDDDSGWFQKIINKINDVWESVKSLPDKIGAYIQNIANDISEGLKELFIPSDDYFENYAATTKEWAAEHFGFLYTASDLLLSLVDDIGELLQDDFSFVMPAAEFDLNGEHYVIWEAYEVPVQEYIDNVPALKFAYNCYLAILCGSFAFALFAYARQTYDKIMST